jgi:hypothetical protein
MRIIVLYRPDSEHARATEDFMRDYQLRYGPTKFEIQNIDASDGGATASLYDIQQYPAILALREDGQLLHSWEGGEMPLMDEIAGYAFS